MSDTGPAASEIKKLREAIEGAKYEGASMEANSGDSSGKSWLSNVIAILQALAIAGILGLFAKISGFGESIARLETTINERGKQNDRDIERIDATLTRHDQRLTDLERGQGPGEPDTNHRQKR